MKFKDMPYQRPDLDEVKKQITAITEQLKNAKDYAEAKEAFLAKDTLAAEGPYYAQKIRPLFIGSIPGLKVDGSCRILAGDTPIENLYGAGELIFANVFQDHYPSSGTGIGVSAYTGAIAADAAIADMN